MKTMKILFVIIVVITAGFLVWAIFLPSEVDVDKSIEINAPIELVFNNVNNFRTWDKWSPWKDTVFQTAFTGDSTGVGSVMIWRSKRIGNGEQKILISDFGKHIQTELKYEGGSAAKSDIYFEQVGEKVKVSWKFKSNQGFSYPLGRFVAYFLQKGMDHNYSLALENLKTYSEQNK